MCVALVAELRMLSSGESPAVVTTPVKPEHTVNCDNAALMSRLLEPGTMFNEVYPDCVITALRRLVFSQLVNDTDVYRWRSLGYWLCSQLSEELDSVDLSSQSSALHVMTNVARSFTDSVHSIGERSDILLSSLFTDG